MSRVLFSAFALSTLLGACVFEDDEDIWMPPGSGGKADGVQIIKGNTIPSQHVSQTKDYLTSRLIGSLHQVGALPAGDAYELAKRADGIIANLPANGRIEAAELARMESPQIFATLFPNEQAALPGLWPLLEAPSGGATHVQVPGADLSTTEQSTQPGGLTPPASILISSLDTAWQQVARRVQLVFDMDATSSTIQVTDIQKVLQDPQAFTPAEVTLLNLILAEFHKRATSFEEAKVVVPEPGTLSKHTQLGMMGLDFTSDLVIHEQRNLNMPNGSWSTYSVGGSLQLEATSSGSLAAPAGAKMILLSLGDGTELVLEGAQPTLSRLAVGDYVIERYDLGARKETFLFALPGFTPGLVRADATKFMDYVMVTPSGAPLVKNAVSSAQNGTAYGASFHHELQATTAPGVDPNVIATLQTPWTNLPSGRYEVTLNNTKVILDLYPQRVAIATVGVVSGRMSLRAIQTQNPYPGFVGTAGTVQVQFAPGSNELIAWLGNQTPRITLTPAHRTK